MRQNARKLSQFFELRSIFDIPTHHAHMIVGVRHSVLCRKCGRDPHDDLVVHHKSVAIARSIAQLADHAEQIWPDNFMIMRPCCPVMSPDEASLSEALSAIEAGNTRAFNHVMCGLLNDESKARLMSALAMFAGSVRA